MTRGHQRTSGQSGRKFGHCRRLKRALGKVLAQAYFHAWRFWAVEGCCCARLGAAWEPFEDMVRGGGGRTEDRAGERPAFRRHAAQA